MWKKSCTYCCTCDKRHRTNLSRIYAYKLHFMKCVQVCSISVQLTNLYDFRWSGSTNWELLLPYLLILIQFDFFFSFSIFSSTKSFVANAFPDLCHPQITLGGNTQLLIIRNPNWSKKKYIFVSYCFFGIYI